jgi:hypothetical protein
MIAGYAFHIRLLHSLLSADFYRRFLDVPEVPPADYAGRGTGYWGLEEKVLMIAAK